MDVHGASGLTRLASVKVKPCPASRSESLLFAFRLAGLVLRVHLEEICP